MDDIIIEIDEGKILCPTCRYKYESTQLYSNGEIINLAELLGPEDHDKFLSKAGFQKKLKRRTSKFALIFLILIMAASAMVGAMSMETDFIYKIFIGLIFIGTVIWEILRYYKDGKKPKWYRER